VGGRRLRPDPRTVYEFESVDPRGYSTTFDARDRSGREWSVKIGNEAQPEVVVSRILWAVGYRQVPSYYLGRWQYRRDGRELSELHARLRPKVPAFRSEGFWPWRDNPFVGTRQYRGLLALLVLLNSTDLKDENNGLYERRDGTRVLERFYVVKDLGASLGETGTHNPARGDIDAFERDGYIRGVDDGRVEFVYRGGHRDLLDDIRPDDVRWVCARVARIRQAQWSDAFRAAGIEPDIAARFVAKIRQKVAEGLALPAGGGRQAP
jgi:hypothetical protein